MSAPPLLAADGLAKSFGGVAALRDVSFALGAGEVLALIGPNGAGKSTCFNCLNGQLRPDAGTVRLAGQDITGWPPERTGALGIGRTFQVAAVFRSMNVRENVQIALLAAAGEAVRPFGFAGARHRREADALLADLGLDRLADAPCGSLAYGDAKRLDLALALANRPRLLLMDEPTAGMAPDDRADVMRLAVRLARRDGIGILFTEHDMEAVFGHADRVMVLNRGALLAIGLPDAVRQDPAVRDVYLGGGRVSPAISASSPGRARPPAP